MYIFPTASSHPEGFPILMVCCFFMALGGGEDNTTKKEEYRKRQNPEQLGLELWLELQLWMWNLGTPGGIEHRFCPCLSHWLATHSFCSPIACLLASFLVCRVPLCPILYHTAGRCPFARMWPWPCAQDYRQLHTGMQRKRESGYDMELVVWAMSLQCLRWPGESYLSTDATKWSCFHFQDTGYRPRGFNSVRFFVQYE